MAVTGYLTKVVFDVDELRHMAGLHLVDLCFGETLDAVDIDAPHRVTLLETRFIFFGELERVPLEILGVAFVIDDLDVVAADFTYVVDLAERDPLT